MTQGNRGTTALAKVLNELERVLAQAKPPIQLRPPLASQELTRLAGKLPYELPPEVREIYQWKDGEDGNPGFFEEFALMPFECVVAAVKVHGKLYPPGWLPLLTNGGGDFLYVNASHRRESPLYLWRVYDQIRDLAWFDSVPSFFHTVLEAHRANVFKVVQRRVQYLQEDDIYIEQQWDALEIKDQKRWATLARRLNPNSRGNADGERAHD